MKIDTTTVLIGAGGLLTVYLLTQKSTTTPGSTTTSSGVSNYDTQVATHPNLLNPNYQLTAAECQQYYNNYQDLRTACPEWVGTYELDGGDHGNQVYIATLNQALQRHWTIYGCYQHYTFYPLIPSSTKPFVPAQPANNNSSGSSGSGWVGSALSLATTLVGFL